MQRNKQLLAGIVMVALTSATSGAAAQEAAQSAAAAQSVSQPGKAEGQGTAPQAGTATDATTAPEVAQKAPVEGAPAKKTYTVPAGTKVLLQLRSALNTRSARPGDGVYLSSTFPVVVGNRVMIPSGVYVQGMVDRVQRAGRVKGRAQLDMHFTSIIFPNGSVVEVPGLVNSMPGSRNQVVKSDGEGTIQQDGDKGRNAGRTAEIALPTGAGVGGLGGAMAGHPISGSLAGLGAGLAAVGLVSLFTRGADVNIDAGTQVEMVLQRPLLLEESNLVDAGSGTGTTPQLLPVANQPKPMEKPKRTRVLCPLGGLGCD